MLHFTSFLRKNSLNFLHSWLCHCEYWFDTILNWSWSGNDFSLLFICFVKTALCFLMAVVYFSRLYVLQGALAQQEWRVHDLLHRLIDYLQPHIAHTYKSVRDRLGRSVFSLQVFKVKTHQRKALCLLTSFVKSPTKRPYRSKNCAKDRKT